VTGYEGTRLVSDDIDGAPILLEEVLVGVRVGVGVGIGLGILAPTVDLVIVRMGAGSLLAFGGCVVAAVDPPAAVDVLVDAVLVDDKVVIAKPVGAGGKPEVSPPRGAFEGGRRALGRVLVEDDSPPPLLLLP